MYIKPVGCCHTLPLSPCTLHTSTWDAATPSLCPLVPYTHLPGMLPHPPSVSLYPTHIYMGCCHTLPLSPSTLHTSTWGAATPSLCPLVPYTHLYGMLPHPPSVPLYPTHISMGCCHTLPLSLCTLYTSIWDAALCTL